MNAISRHIRSINVKWVYITLYYSLHILVLISGCLWMIYFLASGSDNFIHSLRQRSAVFCLFRLRLWTEEAKIQAWDPKEDYIVPEYWAARTLTCRYVECKLPYAITTLSVKSNVRAASQHSDVFDLMKGLNGRDEEMTSCHSFPGTTSEIILSLLHIDLLYTSR